MWTDRTSKSRALKNYNPSSEAVFPGASRRGSSMEVTSGGLGHHPAPSPARGTLLTHRAPWPRSSSTGEFWAAPSTHPPITADRCSSHIRDSCPSHRPASENSNKIPSVRVRETQRMTQGSLLLEQNTVSRANLPPEQIEIPCSDQSARSSMQ